MSLFYLTIIRGQEPAHELCNEEDLKVFGFASRGTIRPFLKLFSKTIAQNAKPGQRKDVQENDYTFHVYTRSEGVTGIAITKDEYPSLVAHSLLTKCLEQFLVENNRSTWETGTPTLDFPKNHDDKNNQTYIQAYKDPTKVDNIANIQKELDETKIMLHKTIDSVLQRGEKIDDLVAKSDGLSAQSKMFYQQAKKQNSCCILM